MGASTLPNGEHVLIICYLLSSRALGETFVVQRRQLFLNTIFNPTQRLTFILKPSGGLEQIAPE